MPRHPYIQYAATRLYTGAIAYSPDGRLIGHVTNTTGQFNLWTIPSGGGIPRQLTALMDSTVRQFAWSPDGEYLVYQADENGDEFHQLYRLPTLGGWGEKLTTNPKAQHHLGSHAFSKDGRYLAYVANDVIPENQDAVIRDLQTGELSRPFPSGDGLYELPIWSNHGRYMTVIRATNNMNSDALLYDRQTDEVKLVTPHEGMSNFYPVGFAPDDSGFYMVTDYQREFMGLAFYTIASGTWEYVESPNHDIENYALSEDGARLIWGVNEGGRSRLYGRDLVSGSALTLPDLPLGVVNGMALSPDGQRLALALARPTEASNLYEFYLETGELIPLGQSMLGGIDPATMIEPELIAYPTHDGRQIPAWLYRPKGTGKFPVVLSIHGGPDAQERPGYAYNGLYQYLLSRGFGILAPNIRGSTGYGKSYQHLIYRDWGGAELRDIEHAALYLRSLDWVDANRIAVFGGSFGGFATLSAVTRLPDYWAVGVDIVGPANLITFVNSVPPHWRSMLEVWIGDGEKDREMLIERSPITYVHQVKVPLLVIQGANDPRVVQAESDQMVEKIRAQGGDVRYYVDEHEGHGTTRRESTIRWMKMIADYLEEYLLDEPLT